MFGHPCRMFNTCNLQSYYTDPKHGHCQPPSASDSMHFTVTASATYSPSTGPRRSLMMRYMPDRHPSPRHNNQQKRRGAMRCAWTMASRPSQNLLAASGPPPWGWSRPRGSPPAELSVPGHRDTPTGRPHHVCSQAPHLQQSCVDGHLTWPRPPLYVF